MDIIKILENNDIGGLTERPEYFDLDKALAKAAKCVCQIEAVTGGKYKISPQSLTQDATFFFECQLPTEITISGQLVMLRFSAFAELTALTRESSVKPKVLSQIKEVLLNHNFIYVDENTLRQKRSNRGQCVKTWAERYFDYL